MYIVMVSPECAPVAKVGGLADVCASLTPQLVERGHDVRIFLPFYEPLLNRGLELEPVLEAQQVPLPLAGRYFTFNVFETEQSGVPLYLVQCAPLFERGDAVYTMHADEPLRWVFFCRAVLETLQRMVWAPDLLHLHDWPTALMPVLLKTVYAWDQLFARTRTVFTIHNLGYQGVFGTEVLEQIELAHAPQYFDPGDLAAGRINFLKTGLTHSDRLSTVSPSYAEEIQTPLHGHGLDGLLRERAADLRGILNGIDESEWGAEADRSVPVRYGAGSLWRKRHDRHALLARTGLSIPDGVPVLGIVSRLAEQKGFDLLPAVLESVLEERDVALVVLGSGEAHIEHFFRDLAERRSDRVAFSLGYDEALSHLIEAGSDLFLMPSHYEPCGLNQMYSQRYGTLPVVHRTGGLRDTVEPYDERTGQGTGFAFAPATVEALSASLGQALDVFENRPVWESMMRQAMSRHFGWGDRAADYGLMYREATAD